MRWIIYGAIQERHLTTSLATALREAGHEVTEVDSVTRVYVTEPAAVVAEEAARRIEAAMPADALFCIRVDEPSPELIGSLRDRGVLTVAWFLDDPLHYASIYRHVVEAYDLTLHTGHEQVLAHYEDSHGVRGYHFPFFTDDAHFPYVWDPATADTELGFLGNCSAPRERDRYPLLASLPFPTRFFGRLPKRAEDWAGIGGGYLSEDEIPRTLARFKVGLNLTQPFDETVQDQYSWEGVGRFHEFFFPSRLAAYAAAGIPAVALQHPAMPSPLAATTVVASRLELIEAVGELLADEQGLRERSRATRAEFEVCLSAASRVRLLELLIGGDREHDVATRAELWRWTSDVAPPAIPPRFRARRPPQPLVPARVDRVRVLVIGRGLRDASPAGGLVADAAAAGVEAVAIDVGAMPALARDPFTSGGGEGPVEIHDEVLARLPAANDVDAAIFLDGCAPSEKGASELRTAGVGVIALRLTDPAFASQAASYAARFDRIVTTSERAEALYRGAGIDARLIEPGAWLDPAGSRAHAGTARVRGGDPEVAGAIAWRLAEVADVTAGPASIEVFAGDAPGTVSDALAAAGAGALPVVAAGAPLPSVEPVDGAIAVPMPSGGLGLATYAARRPDEAATTVEALRAGIAAGHRWAHRWPAILQGVTARIPRGIVRPRMLVLGHYGRGNLGDDLILHALWSRLEADLTAVTYEPVAVVAEHGLPAVDIREPLDEHLRASAVAVIGGGGLLHDLSFRDGGAIEHVFGGSTRMLPAMARFAARARAIGTPLALLSIGVGPLEDHAARRIVRFICEQASVVSVRDAASEGELRACGFDGDVLLGADPVLLLPEPGPERSVAWLRANGVEGLYLAVAVRPWEPDLQKLLVTMLDEVGTATGLPIVFVPFQRGSGRRSDAGAARAVIGRMAARAVLADVDPETARSLIGGAQAVVAMRLHASILAASAGVPAIGIAYDPKVAAFFSEIGWPELALSPDVDPSGAATVVTEVLAERDETAWSFGAAAARLRERADAAVRAVRSLATEPRPMSATPRAAVDEMLEQLRHALESGVDTGTQPG